MVIKALRQSDPLSISLFNVALEDNLQKSYIHIDTDGIMYRKQQVITFVHDIALITISKNELELLSIFVYETHEK